MEIVKELTDLLAESRDLHDQISKWYVKDDKKMEELMYLSASLRTLQQKIESTRASVLAKLSLEN